MSNIFYFGIPDTKNRTTGQQTDNWLPNAYKQLGVELTQVRGSQITSEVSGSVFSSAPRGLYSLTQNASFLEMVNEGKVQNGDKLHYQDFWTPGIEAIYYTNQLDKLDLEIYGSVLAQSVDEYDFTYPLRHWMRDFERGLDKGMTGIFVANQMLKELLLQIGFTAPIHVVGLPFNSQDVRLRVDYRNENTVDAVIHTSRLDWEKNPLFMLKVAEEFLEDHEDWEWWIATGLSELKSNDSYALRALQNFKHPRFKIFVNTTKNEYYALLNEAKIIFNAALQDWVSYTVIEATTVGCDICYPNFRSFPEFIPEDRMYRPFNVKSALEVLDRAIYNPTAHPSIPYLSDLGALLMAYIVKNGIDREVNIWLERYWVERLLENEVR